MTTSFSTFIDAQARQVHLGECMGFGGEAEIFTVAGDDRRLAKKYLPSATIRPDKLTQMVTTVNPTLLNVAAWPIATLHDPGGKIVGFLMERAEGYRPISDLFVSKTRMQVFPGTNWRFLVHTAMNVTRVFTAMHQAGVIIGDISAGNILVAKDATIKIVDCDSFQFGKWPCGGGTTSYQPPEIQAFGNYSVIRTANHDNFGLAVLIFQLLCVGRHPFEGVFEEGGEPPTPEEAIKAFRYVYSTDHARTRMSPGIGSLPIEALPQRIRDMFELAFGPTTTKAGRPTAEDWTGALTSLLAQTRKCQTNDAHYFFSNAPHCVWCEINTQIGANCHFASAPPPQIMPPQVSVPPWLPLQATPRPTSIATPLARTLITVNMRSFWGRWFRLTNKQRWQVACGGIVVVIWLVRLFRGAASSIY